MAKKRVSGTIVRIVKVTKDQTFDHKKLGTFEGQCILSENADEVSKITQWWTHVHEKI